MEGGGQILRTAIALSTLTHIPFIADKIRAHRPRPGIKHQHLACINALQQIANARVKGARLGSAAIEYKPGVVAPGSYSIDIGTAGSITLLLQSLMLPLMFAADEVKLEISGGTDTKWSIPADYFLQVILPHTHAFARVEMSTIKRGFYPKGRGRIRLFSAPRFHSHDFKNFSEFKSHLRANVPAFKLTSKTELVKIKGISSASLNLQQASVAERQIQGARSKLRYLCPVDIEKEYCQTASAGTVITIWTIDKNQNVFIGADALGERGKRAEKVGADAAGKLLGFINSDGVVDHHLADNLIPLLALVGGKIRTDKITGHIRSNIYVCEKFLDTRFDIDEDINAITAK
jgi:RNA 3'-phosphate cyclase